MQSALKYGLVAALGMILWTLAEYASGLHGPRIAYERYADPVTQLILLIVLWRLLRFQVNSVERYWLPVWRGLLQGLFAALVAGMGFYIFLSIYLNFINREFPDVYLEWHVAQMRAAGQTEATIREMARGFRWSMSPPGLLISVIGLNLLIGFVASPVLTLWLNWRRKEPAHIG